MGSENSPVSRDVWGKPGQRAIMALLTARSDRSRAMSTVASPNGSTGSSVLFSVATTPGASIVQAVGYSGVYQAFNPLAMQNG